MADEVPPVELGGQVDLTETNPYKVLRLGFEATEDDIEKAYKQLSLQFNPDETTNEQFGHLCNARALLMDSNFRAKYISAMNKVPKIQSALETYSREPEHCAFIDVYTAIFDMSKEKEYKNVIEHVNLPQMLHSEICKSVERLADCLREARFEPHQSWLNRVISEMYEVRNHLYCLQAGFGHAGRFMDLNLTFLDELTGARKKVGIDELSSNFWRAAAEVVQEVECAMILPDLINIWCRCGCPIVALQNAAMPKDHRVYDAAMRAAFPVLNAKLLSPSLLISTFPITCVFHIQNRPLIVMVAAFLSSADLYEFFCLRNGRRRWHIPVDEKLNRAREVPR